MKKSTINQQFVEQIEVMQEVGIFKLKNKLNTTQETRRPNKTFSKNVSRKGKTD